MHKRESSQYCIYRKFGVVRKIFNDEFRDLRVKTPVSLSTRKINLLGKSFGSSGSYTPLGEWSKIMGPLLEDTCVCMHHTHTLCDAVSRVNELVSSNLPMGCGWKLCWLDPFKFRVLYHLKLKVKGKTEAEDRLILS